MGSGNSDAEDRQIKMLSGISTGIGVGCVAGYDDGLDSILLKHLNVVQSIRNDLFLTLGAIGKVLRIR